MKTLYTLFLFLVALTQINGFTTSKPEIVNLRQRQDSVELNEKLEIALELKCEFVNPFDPDDIDIQTVFTSSTGKKWNIPGSYNLSGATLWKIRFSPNETGKWTYSVKVRDKNGEAVKEGQSFVAEPQSLVPFLSV